MTAARYGSALIACARRDFVLDARFLCTMRLSAMRSMTACDSRSVVVAAALSPVAIAFLTFLTAVRSADFKLALRWRVASAWRARLRACAVLAMKYGPCSTMTPRVRLIVQGLRSLRCVGSPRRQAVSTGVRGSGGAAWKDR